MRGISRRAFIGRVGVGAAVAALPNFLLFARRGEAAGIAHPLPEGWLSTKDDQIVAADNPNGPTYRLAGANWYGFECNSCVVGGLDLAPLDTIVGNIATFGFNFIRLPFSIDLVAKNPVVRDYVSQQYNPNLYGAHALTILDRVIASAANHGLKVVLDAHRSSAGWSTRSNGLWYDSSLTEAIYVRHLLALVRRYRANSTVIGIDLHNEPDNPPPDRTAWPSNSSASAYPYTLGASWGLGDPNPNPYVTPSSWDWAAAAARVGNAVLDPKHGNPNLLVIVEGVRYDPAGDSPEYWVDANYGLAWPGENLLGTANGGSYVNRDGIAVRRTQPNGVGVTLDVPNKLVYSVHDYGPDYAALPWCQGYPTYTANTPTACDDFWSQTWGFVHAAGTPVLVGEFGTENGYQEWTTSNQGPPIQPQNEWTDAQNSMQNYQGYWFSYLVNYIAANGLHWCYWALNGRQSYCGAGSGRDPDAADYYGVFDPYYSATAASPPMMAKLQSIM